MEERSRARRSVLAVPGSSPRMLGKASGLPADEVFLDLEDAVAPAAREAARANVVDAIRGLDWGPRTLAVRINGVTTPWWEEDLAAVAAAPGLERLDVVVVPKVERPEDVRRVAEQLERAEATAGRSAPVGLEVLIESAPALVHVDGIAAASDRLEALVFGPGDMSASLGLPATTVGAPMPGYPGDHLHAIRSRIVVAARAAGLQAIDGPDLRIDDPGALRETTGWSRALGFDGRWVVHPSQIEVVNEAFAPTAEEFRHATALLEAYARATEEGRGAVRFGDEMIDEASRKMAEVVVARGRAAGLAADA